MVEVIIISAINEVETAVQARTHGAYHYQPMDFDYDGLLAELKDWEVLKGKFKDTDVGYEKVQIFRIASELGGDDVTTGDAAFKKFVNESYHIENEYVMQLNPREFDAVPEHVVQLCSALLS